MADSSRSRFHLKAPWCIFSAGPGLRVTFPVNELCSPWILADSALCCYALTLHRKAIPGVRQGHIVVLIRNSSSQWHVVDGVQSYRLSPRRVHAVQSSSDYQVVLAMYAHTSGVEAMQAISYFKICEPAIHMISSLVSDDIRRIAGIIEPAALPPLLVQDAGTAEASPCQQRLVASGPHHVCAISDLQALVTVGAEVGQNVIDTIAHYTRVSESSDGLAQGQLKFLPSMSVNTNRIPITDVRLSDWLVVPICARSHWVVYIIPCAEHATTMYLCDSSGAGGSTCQRLAYWARHQALVHNRIGHIIDCPSVEQVDFGKQEVGDVNCGAYVGVLIYLLHNHCTPSPNIRDAIQSAATIMRGIPNSLMRAAALRAIFELDTTIHSSAALEFSRIGVEWEHAALLSLRKRVQSSTQEATCVSDHVQSDVDIPCVSGCPSQPSCGVEDSRKRHRARFKELSCCYGCSSPIVVDQKLAVHVAAKQHIHSHHSSVSFSALALRILEHDLTFQLTQERCTKTSCTKRALNCPVPSCSFQCRTADLLIAHQLHEHEHSIADLVHIPAIAWGFPSVDFVPADQQSASWLLDGASNSSRECHLHISFLAHPNMATWGDFWNSEPSSLQACLSPQARSLILQKLRLLSASFTLGACDDTITSTISRLPGCRVCMLTTASIGCRLGLPHPRCSSQRQIAVLIRCGEVSEHAGVCFANASKAQVLAAHAFIIRSHTPAHNATSRVLRGCLDNEVALELSLEDGKSLSLAAGTAGLRIKARAVQLIAHLERSGHPPPDFSSWKAEEERSSRAMAKHTCPSSSPSPLGLDGILELLRDRSHPGGLCFVRFAGNVGSPGCPSWLLSPGAQPGPYVIVMSDWAIRALQCPSPTSVDLWQYLIAGDGVAKLTKEGFGAYSVRAPAPWKYDVLGAGSYPEGTGWRSPRMLKADNSRKYMTIFTVFYPDNAEGQESLTTALRLVNLVCGYSPVGQHHACHLTWKDELFGWIQTSGAITTAEKDASYEDTYAFHATRFICSDARTSLILAHSGLCSEFAHGMSLAMSIFDPPHLSTNLKQSVVTCLLDKQVSRKTVHAVRALPWLELADPLFSSVDIELVVSALTGLRRSIVALTADEVDTSVVSDAVFAFLLARVERIGGPLSTQCVLFDAIFSSQHTSVASRKVRAAVAASIADGDWTTARQCAGVLPSDTRYVHAGLSQCFSLWRYLELQDDSGDRPFLVGHTRACESLHSRQRAPDGTAQGEMQRRLPLAKQVLQDAHALLTQEEHGTQMVFKSRVQLLTEGYSAHELAEALLHPNSVRARQLIVAAWHSHLVQQRVLVAERLRQEVCTSISSLRRDLRKHRDNAQQHASFARLTVSHVAQMFVGKLQKYVSSLEERRSHDTSSSFSVTQQSSTSLSHAECAADAAAPAAGPTTSCRFLSTPGHSLTLDPSAAATLIDSCRCSACTDWLSRITQTVDLMKARNTLRSKAHTAAQASVAHDGHAGPGLTSPYRIGAVREVNARPRSGRSAAAGHGAAWKAK